MTHKTSRTISLSHLVSDVPFTGNIATVAEGHHKADITCHYVIAAHGENLSAEVTLDYTHNDDGSYTAAATARILGSADQTSVGKAELSLVFADTFSFNNVEVPVSGGASIQDVTAALANNGFIAVEARYSGILTK